MIDEVSFLEELVSIPSPSGQEDAVAGYLVRQMVALGFRAWRDEAGNVVGMLGDVGAERAIVLLGHIDTVPGLVPMQQEGGRLYGRGAVDAKGPLAAFVLAAARVAPRLNGVPFDRAHDVPFDHAHGARLVVVGAVEEEAHSRGARHLTRTMQPPDCAIIGEPGGWEGITLGYKGVLSVEYRLARPAGHSASGQPTPAEEAVAFWNWLADHAVALNGGRAWRFNTLDPVLQTMRTSGDGLEEGVEMGIGLRLPPGLDVVALQQEMLALRNGAQLTFPYSELPFQAEKNTPLVRALLQAIRAKGGRPRFKLKTGTSDMNAVGPAWGCPIVAYGPGDSSLDHTCDEHIEIEEFRRGVDVLTQALEILAG